MLYKSLRERISDLIAAIVLHAPSGGVHGVPGMEFSSSCSAWGDLFPLGPLTPAYRDTQGCGGVGFTSSLRISQNRDLGTALPHPAFGGCRAA